MDRNIRRKEEEKKKGKHKPFHANAHDKSVQTQI